MENINLKYYRLFRHYHESWQSDRSFAEADDHFD